MIKEEVKESGKIRALLFGCCLLILALGLTEVAFRKSIAVGSAQSRGGKVSPPIDGKWGVEAAPDDAQVISYDGLLPPKKIGSPTLTSSTAIARETEPNNTTATATPLVGRDLKIKGNLFPNGDIDFYSFTANAGDRFYAATMTSFSAGSSTDSQLTLLASDGTSVIEFDDDNGSFAGLSSSIAGATLPTSGTYYIKVNDFTAGTTTERPYELWMRLQNGTPTAEVESNDTPATANVLPASGWVSGTRNPAAATEQDWYSMSLNAGDTVYLSLDLDPERDGVIWNGRLGLALFGDAGNQILVVDDAGTGDVSPNPNLPSEALFFTVKDAGTYYAFVDSASAAVGGPTATYNLSVSVLPRTPVGVNCTLYPSADVPKTIGPGTGLVSSTITIPGHPRIASVRVFINATHAQMADMDVHLRTPAGNDNGLFTDIGAAATGGQQQMDLVLDDDAGVPPSFTVLKGVGLKPELAYRLGWLKGEDAGGTWTLDIRDDGANASGGTLNSWAIEICEEPPPASCSNGSPQTIFSTDFESGTAGFTHSGTADEWELGLPATVATTTTNPVAAFTTCNSGMNCWKTDLDNTYNVSSSQDLLSPNINLTGWVGPITLTWAMRYQMESASFDHASVNVREVGNPSNTQRVWEWYDATMTDAPGNPAVNIGESAGWGLYRADLSAFAGKNVEVLFHLDSDNTINFGGLAIDDVSVTACTAVVACQITCPANITQANDSNQCGAVINYPAPTTTGGCGTITCMPSSGSFFPKGTTTVSCQDAGGSPGAPTAAASCSFTVTINDTQAPTITCPSNITKGNDVNQCGAVATYSTPMASDNCSNVGTVTCSPSSGSFFPKGTTTVTCNVSDAAGNPASCSFTVTINDTQAPSITCPSSVTSVTPVPGGSGNIVTYPPPTASDNCPGVTASCTPPSGSVFPVGTTSVTCTATDTSGNTASCSFSVAVFNAWLQDESAGCNSTLLFNTLTGDYRFCCGGTVFTGKGTVKQQGSIYTLTHNPTDRRLLATMDGATRKGNASFQYPVGTTRCTIRDDNVTNNTCMCGAGGGASAPTEK
ncbi:MAG: HYR domain-containing protein [Blastocatellia bacterium]